MFVSKGSLFALIDTLKTIKQWQSNTFQDKEMLLFVLMSFESLVNIPANQLSEGH